MTLNFPGPYELRFFYAVRTLEHSLRLSLLLSTTPGPGEDFVNILTDAHDGISDTSLDIIADQVAVLLQPFLENASDISRAELWYYTPGTFDAQFVSQYAIAVNGTGGVSTAVLAGEVIFTFRTVEGGVMKVYIEEGVSDFGNPVIPPYAGIYAALAAYIIDDANSWVGRDTSRPFGNIAYYRGQNERIFRKRYRP